MFYYKALLQHKATFILLFYFIIYFVQSVLILHLQIFIFSIKQTV